MRSGNQFAHWSVVHKLRREEDRENMWKEVIVATCVALVHAQEQQCTGKATWFFWYSRDKMEIRLEENRVPSFKPPDNEFKLLSVTFNQSTDKLEVLFQAPVAKSE